MSLWALSLRDQERDPTNRDIDNEAQGVAAEAAARQNTGRGNAPGTTVPVEVRIDWSGLARRARQISVPGTIITGLTPAPEGHAVALTVSSGGVGGGRGAAAGPTENPSGVYIINVESDQQTRVPPAPPSTGAAGGGRGRGGAGGVFGGGGNMVFARDGRTLYFRSGSELYAATIPASATAGPNAPAAGGGRGGRGGGGAGATAADTSGGSPAARQVTYSATLEVDHKALRTQVFNEGWRIMKNRFYDGEMHGADWAGAKKTYEPLLDYLVDEEELHTV